MFLHRGQFPYVQVSVIFKLCKSAKVRSQETYSGHHKIKQEVCVLFFTLLCCMHKKWSQCFIKTINLFSSVTFVTQLSTFPTTNYHYRNA